MATIGIVVELVLCLMGLATWRWLYVISYPERYRPIPIPQYVDDVPVTMNSPNYGGFV